MTEVVAAPPSPSPLSQLGNDSADPASSLSSVQPAQTREWIPNYAQNRMSQYSQQSQQSQRSHPSQSSQQTWHSRPHSNVYPAFASSLAYALVRDFAYPAFHPMHYGADPDQSGQSTPISEWNPARRQSDPMEHLNASGGWTSGSWGGDGVTGDDGESLPSTSFGGGDTIESDDDAALRRTSRPRKSKSYTSMADFERGRRRDSDGPPYFYTGQQTDPAGRDSLRLSRGHSGSGADGPRRISPYPSSTLPRSSFGPQPRHSLRDGSDPDPDAAMPLDAEPHAGAPALRESLGPEDEDLFAGLSLALYSFEPENSNELRLVEGQEILVSYRHGQGWLVASDPRTGEQGLVPEAYVRLIADIPGYDPETGQFVDLEGEEFEAQDEAAGGVAVGQEEDDDDEEEESEGLTLSSGATPSSEPPSEPLLNAATPALHAPPVAHEGSAEGGEAVER